MKKYKITIVHENLPDILTLMNIIDSYCMNVVEVCYFIGAENALYHLKNSETDIIILDQRLLDIAKSRKLITENNSVIVFVKNMEHINLSQEKNLFQIEIPFKIENVILMINNVLKERLKLLGSNVTHQLDKQFMTVTSLDRTDFIDLKNITYCRAEGRYTSINLHNGKNIMSCKNLGEYEKQLSQKDFYRIHHGYIVNIHHMKRIVKSKGIFCEMKNETILPISKRKITQFTKYIKDLSNSNLLEFS